VARLGELRRLLGRREDSSDARPFHLLQERPRRTRQARDCANDAGLPHDTGHTGGGGQGRVRVGVGGRLDWIGLGLVSGSPEHP
jgi:hypothetical protein